MIASNKKKSNMSKKHFYAFNFFFNHSRLFYQDKKRKNQMSVKKLENQLIMFNYYVLVNLFNKCLTLIFSIV